MTDIISEFEKKFNIVSEECLNFMNKLDEKIDLPESMYFYFTTRIENLILKNSGLNSVHIKTFEHLKATSVTGYEVARPRRSKIYSALAILRALRNDINSGYLRDVGELISSDLFSDFLEMAEHLLEEGYKDPAAVIVGSVLEEHIRKLCAKNSLPIDATDSKGATKPKKADSLNSDLAAAGVYGKLDQKNVTAWLDLRNKAAHGQYADYSKSQVELLLQSVRDFITRHPA
jgi:hypothetical protein